VVEGGSLHDANAALEVLARFHAHNWMDEDVAGASHLTWSIDQTPRIWQASYIRNRDEFVRRFADMAGPEIMAKLDAAQEDLPRLSGLLGSQPWTLLHGDYRLDNILYRPNGDLVVVDYQGVAKGRPGWDVAYFITSALTPDLRSDQDVMLRRYHDALIVAGVTDYSWQQLIDDVELTKVLMAHRFVCAIDTLDTQMGSEEALIDILFERVIGWIG
jgi:aminoglycoside phosphotransferase (APT) family kinase protein